MHYLQDCGAVYRLIPLCQIACDWYHLARSPPPHHQEKQWYGIYLLHIEWKWLMKTSFRQCCWKDKWKKILQLFLKVALQQLSSAQKDGGWRTDFSKNWKIIAVKAKMSNAHQWTYNGLQATPCNFFHLQMAASKLAWCVVWITKELNPWKPTFGYLKGSSDTFLFQVTDFDFLESEVHESSLKSTYL